MCLSRRISFVMKGLKTSTIWACKLSRHNFCFLFPLSFAFLSSHFWRLKRKMCCKKNKLKKITRCFLYPYFWAHLFAIKVYRSIFFRNTKMIFCSTVKGWPCKVLDVAILVELHSSLLRVNLITMKITFIPIHVFMDSPFNLNSYRPVRNSPSTISATILSVMWKCWKFR